MWWRVRWKWVVLWSVWAARLVRQPTVPLRTTAGMLRGQIAPDGSHVQYLGVPYAVVEERFKAAKPQPKWKGTFEAMNQHIKCSQRSPFFKNSVSGREDCLVLNVYTPLEALQNPNQQRPVMVFIHGGGFRDGSGSPFLYSPDYLVKHNVILVTIYYRLEVLGFLCLRTHDAPGNAGLKDQVEALRWVKKNIRVFGGDPDNVTIFGESAGSASVMYHLISPMSQGLFHKAILQSGSAMSPWSFQFEPLKYASLFANQMGLDTENSEELHKTFMSKTPDELLHTRVPRKKGDVVLSENIFVPCVEDKLDGVEQFLPDLPYNLITKGLFAKVPIIMGYNSNEGLMFAGKENDTRLEEFNYHESIPRDLDIPTDEEKIAVSKTLEQFYNTSVNKIENIARFEGDSGITYPVTVAIDILLRKTDKPIYSYKFSYDGWLNLAKMAYGFIGWPGATHADELFYMFKTEITLITSFLETVMVDRLTTMWTNFAKYGSPTLPSSSSPDLPRWSPLNPKNPRLLVIDKKFSTTPLWGEQSLRFWNQTYTKYRRK